MKQLLVIVFACCSLFAKAQVVFEKLSFADALNKAETQGKYLMVVLDAADCEYCNEVAGKSFADVKLGEQISKKFIAIRAGVGNPDLEQLAAQYEAPGGMAVLFFTASGVLLHKKTGSTTLAKQYADAAATALESEGELLNLNSLTEAFNTQKDWKVLQALLVKRKELYLSTDSLLDEYVKLLPADSLRSVDQMLFLARFAPVLESRADKVFRSNADLFNRAWYRMDLTTRVRTNNSIIYKSRLRAIKARSEGNAMFVANFAASTNSAPQARARAFELNMMEYYRGIKDADRFAAAAKEYFDKRVMNMPVDSVIIMDSLRRKQLLAEAKTETVQLEDGRTVKRKFLNFTPTAQLFMNDLNRAASDLYKMTSNPEHYKIALQWSARSIEFSRMPAAMDTHAKLLYASGNRQQAIALETEAIARQKQKGFTAREYEAVLAAMKAGKDKID